MLGARTLKVVLLGNSGVGKTCLRSQFVHHMFTNAYKATIGGDYLTSKVHIRVPENPDQYGEALEQREDLPADQDRTDLVEKVVNLQIWDTAGQERFNSISQAFYRGADVVVLVYDVSNYELVVALNGWFSRFMEHCHVDNPGVFVLGNKIDKNIVIQKDEVARLLQASSEGGGPSIYDFLQKYTGRCGEFEPEDGIWEITCKKSEMVESFFTRVADYGVYGSESSQPTPLVRFDIDLSNNNQPISKCC